jgi:hypothetical protein
LTHPPSTHPGLFRPRDGQLPPRLGQPDPEGANRGGAVRSRFDDSLAVSCRADRNGDGEGSGREAVSGFTGRPMAGSRAREGEQAKFCREILLNPLEILIFQLALNNLRII